MTDAVRAVEVIREHDAVDPARIVVAGVSQGGGLALAAAGLVDSLAGVMSDLPFLCNFPRAITERERPYAEIVGYLKTHPDRVHRVMETLAYFDAATLAMRTRRRSSPWP